MKKLNLVFSILFGLFFLSVVYAADNPPVNPQVNAQAKDEETHVWTFGKINEGEVAKHEFVLKNESKAVMNIKEVTTSCGCTTSKLQKSVLDPNESTVVEISFNSKGFNGAVQKYAYVKTDNTDAINLLSIDGKIGKSLPTPEAQAANVQSLDNSILKIDIKGEVIKQDALSK
ncbi:MAG: DUF1573 domain-containing protein [Candidatus Omnitrophica bacterium]|nr:DUF1573 domain-containing protein [Candidatus Omnitrophota bacterium]